MEASAEPVKKDKNEMKHTEAKPIKPVYTYDIKTMECFMHSSSGAEAAPLQAGPRNLLVAKFGTHLHESELCNLMLRAPMPKPVKKRPAAAEAAAAAAAEDAPVAAEPVPAAAPVKKRPAAAPAVDPAAAPAVAPAVALVPAPVAAAAAAAADADAPDDYGIMYYKNNSIGVRAKFGLKNQLFCFGGKYCGKTEEQLRAIGVVIVRDLLLGFSVADAKARGNVLAFA